jgi:hypothetical protein
MDIPFQMKKFVLLFIFSLLTFLKSEAQVAITGCTLQGGMTNGLTVGCGNSPTPCNLAGIYGGTFPGPFCGTTVTAAGSPPQTQMNSVTLGLPASCPATVVAEFKPRPNVNATGCNNSGMDSGDLLGINNSATNGTNVGSCAGGSTGTITAGCTGASNASTSCTYIQSGGIIRIWGSSNRGDEIITYTITMVPGGACGPTCNNVTLSLPIGLVKFWAEGSENLVNVLWQVDEEIDLQKYIVEKSNDGITFSPFAEFPSQINNQKGSGFLYQAIDRNPYPNITYYRLLDVDMANRITYHPIIAFIRKSPNALWITQSDKEILIGSEYRSGKNYCLLDMNGRKLRQFNLENGAFSIPKSELAQGLYMINVEDYSTPPTKLFMY